MAWKWMTPRAWYSPTLANETRTSFRACFCVTPRHLAMSLGRAMVNRRQSSGAHHCQITCAS